MKNQPATPLLLGNLITAAFDRAAALTDDPEHATRLAIYTVRRFLVRTHNTALLRLLDQGVESRTARVPVEATVQAQAA